MQEELVHGPAVLPPEIPSAAARIGEFRRIAGSREHRFGGAGLPWVRADGFAHRANARTVKLKRQTTSIGNSNKITRMGGTCDE